MPGAGEPLPTYPDDVASGRAALERVLSSEGFRSAPQLVAFLRFIVERALEGRGGELKGYTIATEALGRPPEFDPQTDPIVRVEAGRLRRALAHYYAGEGADDPVRITIPLGAYLPRFEAVANPSLGPMEETEPAGLVGEEPVVTRRVSRIWTAAAAIAVLTAVAALVVSYVPWSTVPPPSIPPQLAGPEAELAVPGTLPVVALVSGSAITDLSLAEVTQMFSRHLVDALARFDDLIVVKTPAPGAPPGAGADYIFEISAARVGDDLEGFGSLRSAADGRIVWTSSIQRPLPQGPADPELGEIARRVAVRLAEPTGVVHADFRQTTTSPAMQCLYSAHGYRRSSKPADHLAARTCLRALVAREPRFHPAWSQLAIVTLDEYLFGYNQEDESAIERAFAAATTATDLAPASARAREALMRIYFARGNADEALRIGREAVARNPADPEVMADLGARYVQLNRPAEGLPLLERATELRQTRRAFCDFYAYLGAVLLGARNVAEGRLAALLLDDGPYGSMAAALHHAGRGDRAAKLAALRRLLEYLPDFARDPAAVLARQGFAPIVVQRILSTLGSETLDELR